MPPLAQADPLSIELGRRVFLEMAQPQCALCHTLAEAKAAGNVGPNLDDLRPEADRVKAAVVNGIGAMPPYDSLTKEQINAVALYVSAVAGKAK